MIPQSILWSRLSRTRELVADRIQQRLRKNRRQFAHRNAAVPATVEVLEDRTLLASFTVDTLQDQNDGVGTGGVSLREAIGLANSTVGTDTITFDASLAGGTIMLVDQPGDGNNRLEITDDLTITGLGADQLTIDAQDLFQLFYIDGRTNGTIDVEISDLTLQNGNANGSDTANPRGGLPDSRIGGAIYNDEANLTLDALLITQNSANSITGGIFNDHGTLTITGSTISHNTAGGINNSRGTLTVTDSTISHNTGSNGGGIINDGMAIVLGSTLSQNTANSDGGGIFHGSGGTLTVTNSTLSQNLANNDGGGIYNFLENVVITNSTLTGNRADADNSGGGTGGGLFTFDNGVTFSTLFNTIVADNDLGDGTANDIDNKNVEAASSNNLIGDPNSSGGLMHNDASNNIVGQDDGNNGRELLDINTVLETTLADNGGPTQTHALVANSPAIDAGDDTLAVDGMSNPLTTDQRGTGSPRVLGLSVDMGAFETPASPPTLSVNDVTMAEGNSGDTAFTFTVNMDSIQAEDITFDFAVLADTADAADFGGTLPSGTGTITAGNTSTTVTVNVTGDGTVEADETFQLEITNTRLGGNPILPAPITELGFFDTPGLAANVQVVGGTAYVADFDSGLRVLDVSDPEDITELGFFDTPGFASDVQVVGGTAYVADLDSGLRVLDVSDPENITELGFFDTPGLAVDVQVVGSTAYVADGFGGLRVLDVSDPVNITELGFFDTPGFASDVEVVGSTAYVADGSGGLRVLDVSDPENITELGFFDTPGSVQGVQVVGSTAYVADGDGGLRVLNVNDPEDITELGFFDTPRSAENVQVVGSTAYVAVGSVGLRVLDVSDPENITELDVFNTPGTAFGVQVIGSTAYVADESGGLRVLNAPNRVSTTGTITNDDIAELTIDDVTLAEGDSGDTAFVFTVNVDNAQNDDITFDFAVLADTADAADFGSTLPSGTGTITAGNTSATVTVNVQGDNVVEADETFQLEITNTRLGGTPILPAPITELGSFDTPDEAFDVQVVGGTAYVAESDSGLRVLDVSDPENITELGFFDTPGFAESVHVVGSTAYVADVSKGLRVLDVSDPENITELGFFDTPGSVQGVQVVGSTAYVADGDGGLRVLNVNDPEDITELGFFDTPRSAENVQVVGSTAYVAVGSVGLRVLDVSDPENITELGFFDTLGTAFGVQVVGSTAYVADEIEGLRVLNAPNRVSATGTITNDDVAVLSVNDVTMAEGDNGDTAFVFTVSLDQPALTDVTFDFDANTDTATAGSDFTANSGNGTITAGQTSTTITINVTGDGTVEADETFFVDFSNIQGANLVDGQGLGTITNDDIADLSIDDVTMAEGDNGDTAFVFTVSLDQPALTDVTFDFDANTDTATAGTDFTANSGNGTITAGQTSTTITVNVTGDGTVEADETFFVDLSNIQGANLVDGQGLGTITNDDIADLSIDDVTMAEGDSGDTAFVFTVSLDQPALTDVTFDFDANNDTATAGTDFTTNSGNGTITAGQTSTTITINVTGDGTVEADETFFVDLSNIQGANLVDGQGLGTITNDDVADLSIDDVTQAEGDSGDTAFVFTVSLDQPALTDVTFDFDANNDTATAGTDFTVSSSSGTITAGQTSTTITVNVTGDGTVETDETFFVDLSNIQGANIVDGQGLGTITNDDVADTNDDIADLSIDDVTMAEGNSGETAFVFTVSLDQPALTDVTFDFDANTDTATAGSDFTANSGNGTITAGQTSTTITVNVTGDGTVEADETFFVNLSNIQGANLVDGQGLGTITNDDTATITINDVTVIERNNGITQAVFSVTLDNAIDAPLSVDFITDDATATVANNDYTATNGTLNFVGIAGETQTIAVDITGDTDFETDENFSVVLSNLQTNGRNVTIDIGTGDGTIQNDDLVPNQATFVTNAVPTVSINGNFTTLFSGNFDGTPVDATDDIFFWDQASGSNRILFGDAARTQQDNVVDPTLINGGDFTEVFVGDFDGGGNTDLFFWNPTTGRNRLIHLNGGTGSVMGTFQTNVIDPVQINGNDFTTAVVGNLDGVDQADIFFWNSTSGRNRIAHFETVTPGADSNVGSVQDNVIDPTQINGGDFQSVHVGQFETGGLNELLFLNLVSGNNRRISFTAPGGDTATDTVRNGNATLLNGSVFDTIEIADLNGDGLDDVFAWNPNSGQNRSVLTDIDPAADPEFVDNVLASGAVNSDYEQVVRLVEDVFSNAPQDDLFFWNPRTGANRISSL